MRWIQRETICNLVDEGSEVQQLLYIEIYCVLITIKEALPA